MFMNKYGFLFFLIVVFSCDQTGITYENGSVPPREGVNTYELVEGYRLELFASEPLIADPVDMEIDEWGNVYVVEMSGYPLDKSHTGKIKLLKDEDGDGVMDRSILFADELMFPNGVMRWKNGIMVTDAPYVLYLEDRDGDGQSDVRDTILSGFSLSNPHVNVNNPIYGLDNWVYLSHFGRIGTRKYEEEFGDEGSEIRFWGKESGAVLPKNASSKNVRFKPDGSGLEMRSVKGQYGHTFDEWGHHFLTHNSNHIYQEVLESKYVSRNPDAVISKSSEDVSDHGNSTEVYQITTNPDRQLFTPVGLTTSTSGLTYYDGGLFQEPYGNMTTFVAESVSNLVHSDRLEERGGTYRAMRHSSKEEFLASTDSWARPVNLYVGPDGALYVLDYYRRIIEHPEWMSDEAIESGDLYDGYNMGRIYRVTPEGAGKAEWTQGLDLGSKTSMELVEVLESENGWWRRHAQRMLVDRADESVVKELENKVLNGHSVMGRLHALWTLEGINRLGIETIQQALQDKEGGVRENAIRLAEKHMNASPSLTEDLYAMADDAAVKVRFQLLLTLGELDTPKARAIREKLLFGDVEDEWFQLAALTARDVDSKGLLSEVERKSDDVKAGKYLGLAGRLAEMIGGGSDESEIRRRLRQGTTMTGSYGDLETSILQGLVSGLLRNKDAGEIISSERMSLERALFDHGSAAVRSAMLTLLGQEELTKTEPEQLKRLTERAWEKITDSNLDSRYRSQMLEVLKMSDPSGYEVGLKELLNPSEEPEVQAAAMDVLGRIKGTEISEYILDRWGEWTPEVRESALDALMREDGRVEQLLTALEDGTISKTALGWNRTVRLNQYGNEEIRNRARAILAADAGSTSVDDYADALTLEGEVERGLEVYRTNCSICHQVRGKEGIAYGPDLGTVHNWERKDLLANILDPGLSIAPGYDLWEVQLKDGNQAQGIIMNETSSAVDLVPGPGQARKINRNEIESIEAMAGITLMPGFGGTLDEQELADLMVFLKNSQRILEQ